MVRSLLVAVWGTLWLLVHVEPIPAGEPTPTLNEIKASGKSSPETEPLDRLMTRFVREHHVPGAALAVARHGRLLYARGFGYGEVETKQPVQPTSLFRIASISKPITATAILRLVERGRLRLEESFFDVLELTPPEGKPFDSRLKIVTIEHLLTHTGGWDRQQSFDPMFRSVEIARDQGVAPPAMPEQIIHYMLAQPLDFAPGERFAYSNFGYCLLGRVIEKRAGQPYEDYVRQMVLAPLGIRRMRLGRTALDGRASGEVKYYDEKNRQGPAVLGSEVGHQTPLPYGAWCLEAMDSHGGWIASATDLVRFASALDGGTPTAWNSRPGRLGPDSLSWMFRRPAGLAGHDEQGQPKDVYYGLGWSVRPAGGNGRLNAWHTGSLAGTSTILVRRYDGFCWAVLFNSRSDAANKEGKALSQIIDPLVHAAVDEVTVWPEEDLFESYR